MASTLFAWFAILGTATAALVACASESEAAFDDTSSTPTPGTETGSADCPQGDPQEGAECTQPEGTTCAAGECGTTYFACRGARWTSSPPAPKLHCPPRVPTAGDACPRCFPTSQACQFGCVDTSQPAAFAVCVSASSGGLMWEVTPRQCPTFDASAPDAEAQDGS